MSDGGVVVPREITDAEIQNAARFRALACNCTGIVLEFGGGTVTIRKEGETNEVFFRLLASAVDGLRNR